MFFQYDISGQGPSLSEEEESQFWPEQLATYLAPSQERLDAYLDRRVVGNRLAGVGAIVQSRCELTTSELGCAICGVAHAQAGTQRLQYALHHPGWQAEVSARGVVATSRAAPTGDRAARRNGPVHLGEQRGGKAGKPATGRSG